MACHNKPGAETMSTCAHNASTCVSLETHRRLQPSWRLSSTAPSATAKAQWAAPWTGRPTQVGGEMKGRSRTASCRHAPVTAVCGHAVAAALSCTATQSDSIAASCWWLRCVQGVPGCRALSYGCANNAFCACALAAQAWCLAWRAARRSQPASTSCVNR